MFRKKVLKDDMHIEVSTTNSSDALSVEKADTSNVQKRRRAKLLT